MLSDDIILSAARKTLVSRALSELLRDVWKDGIDIEHPTHELNKFVEEIERAVLAKAQVPDAIKLLQRVAASTTESIAAKASQQVQGDPLLKVAQRLRDYIDYEALSPDEIEMFSDMIDVVTAIAKQETHHKSDLGAPFENTIYNNDVVDGWRLENRNTVTSAIVEKFGDQCFMSNQTSEAYPYTNTVDRIHRPPQKPLGTIENWFGSKQWRPYPGNEDFCGAVFSAPLTPQSAAIPEFITPEMSAAGANALYDTVKPNLSACERAAIIFNAMRSAAPKPEGE